MTFVESVKTCFSKYATFSGRASKSEYWWFVLFYFVGNIVANVIHMYAGLLFVFAILLPSLAAGVRRLHDTDRSGWMILISLIPIVGPFILIYFLIQDPKEPNRFGSAPESEPAAAAS